uniref:Uncharacterized protein n=1 Tax=Trichogramma kaykai TaxID=54128 RepID=A0ABD2XIZ8_9HYME
MQPCTHAHVKIAQVERRGLWDDFRTSIFERPSKRAIQRERRREQQLSGSGRYLSFFARKDAGITNINKKEGNKKKKSKKERKKKNNFVTSLLITHSCLSSNRSLRLSNYLSLVLLRVAARGCSSIGGLYIKLLGRSDTRTQLYALQKFFPLGFSNSRD